MGNRSTSDVADAEAVAAGVEITVRGSRIAYTAKAAATEAAGDARGKVVTLERGIVTRGGKLYVRFVDVDGVRRTNLAPGCTRVEARELLSQIERNVKQGQAGVQKPTPEGRAQRTITLSDLVDKFNAQYRPPKVKDIKEYRNQTKSGMCARVLPTLGSRAAAGITSDDVEKMRDALLDGTGRAKRKYAGGSVSWTLARLSKVYTWGIKKKLVAGTNPVSGVEHPNVEQTLDYLAASEVSSLLHFVSTNRELLAERGTPQFGVMAHAGIYAGLRKGELFGLRWLDIDLDRLQLTVAKSYDGLPKGGKTRHVPMHPALARILRAWRDECPKTDKRLVFPVIDVCEGPRMGTRQDMLLIEQWLKLAGCHVPKQRPWHMLRHTFASHFMMAGCNILTLQKLLGHKEIETTMVYAHLAPDFMTTEIARMAFADGPAGVASMEEERRRRAEAGGPK